MAGYEDEYGEALDQVDEEANALSTLQLGVRGYACHVFDDARAAWSLHREQHLIPWRMESDLRVDRFDARNLLDDKALFRRLKKPQRSGGTSTNCSNDDAAMTGAKRELHALRYRDYEVEFPPPVVQETSVENLFPYTYPEDHDDDEEAGGEAYKPPWLVPEHLAQPKSKKLHEIISATAKKAREHRQLEVMLKVRMMQWKFAPYTTSSSADELRFLPQVKLSANAKFGFLEPSHGFHAYYAYLRDENPPLRATSLATVAKNVSGGSLLLGEEYSSDSDENVEELKSQPEDTSTVGIETKENEKPAETDGDDEDRVKKAMRLKRAKLLAGYFQQAALEKKEVPSASPSPVLRQMDEAEAQAAEQGSTSEAAVAAGAEVEAEVEAGDGEANFEVKVEARRCLTWNTQSLSVQFPIKVECAMENAATVGKAKKSSPPLMVDGVAQGMVTFPSKPSHVFRYVLKTKDDAVNIWLEDRKSKQQWKSEEVSVDGFVSSKNAIPHATLSDYVQCFCSCLAASEANGFERDLTSFSTGTLKLTFTLKLRALTSEWTPRYTFKLEPVALEPVAVLSSKLRDQEEEIEKLRSALGVSENSKAEAIAALRAEVEEFKKTAQLVFVTAKPKTNVSTSCNVIWQKTASRGDDEVVELTPSGVIRFLKSGLFDVRIAVNHTSSNVNMETFQLLKNGVRLDGCYDTWNVGYQQNAALNCILEVAPNDEFAVVYTGNNYAYPGSSLIIVAMAVY